MKSLLTAVVAAAALSAAASVCAQETPAPAEAPAPADTSVAAAPASTSEPATPATLAEAAAPTQGKGRIVFFRPSRLPGAIYTYHVVEVGDDGKPTKGAERIASLPNGGADVAEVEPGVRSFNITGPMAVNKAEDRLRMEVEPGETYYVEQTVRIGAFTGGFRLVPADEARFKASKTKLQADKVESEKK